MPRPRRALLCSMEDRERPTLLRWALHAEGARVFLHDECVLELAHQADSGLRFTHALQHYTLRTSGAWTPRTVILSNGVEVLRTIPTGFLKPQQFVLADGSAYTVAWTNAPLVKLALRDGQGREALTLRLATEGGVHTETVLAAGTALDERAALLLAFAYQLFGGGCAATPTGTTSWCW